MPQWVRLLKSHRPSALSVAARRHPSVSPSLDGAWGCDRGRDSTFALSARPTHPSDVRARAMPGCERHVNEEELFNLTVSPSDVLSACRAVVTFRLAICSTHTRTDTRGHARARWRRRARFLAVERRAHEWLQEYLESGTNPLKHFNYIWQSPVRWLRAPARMGWNANENILASGRSAFWCPTAR